MAGMGSCRPVPLAHPAPDQADCRIALGFRETYSRHDLEGTMRHLDEDDMFMGTTDVLTKS